jgi:hypothetical protein
MIDPNPNFNVQAITCIDWATLTFEEDERLPSVAGRAVSMLIAFTKRCICGGFLNTATLHKVLTQVRRIADRLSCLRWVLGFWQGACRRCSSCHHCHLWEFIPTERFRRIFHQLPTDPSTSAAPPPATFDPPPALTMTSRRRKSFGLLPKPRHPRTAPLLTRVPQTTTPAMGCQIAIGQPAIRARLATRRAATECRLARPQSGNCALPPPSDAEARNAASQGSTPGL